METNKNFTKINKLFIVIDEGAAMKNIEKTGKNYGRVKPKDQQEYYIANDNAGILNNKN